MTEKTENTTITPAEKISITTEEFCKENNLMIDNCWYIQLESGEKRIDINNKVFQPGIELSIKYDEETALTFIKIFVQREDLYDITSDLINKIKDLDLNTMLMIISKDQNDTVKIMITSEELFDLASNIAQDTAEKLNREVEIYISN